MRILTEKELGQWEIMYSAYSPLNRRFAHELYLLIETEEDFHDIISCFDELLLNKWKDYAVLN